MFLLHRMGNSLTLRVSCHKRRRPQAGGKKNKACLHLKSILGKEIFSDGKIEWANLLTLCVSCHKRRRPQASGKKNKACFHLKSILGKEIFSDGFLTNILCRKCVDKNETLVRKLHEVRESFESSREGIAEKKGGINLNKMPRARFRQ